MSRFLFAVSAVVLSAVFASKVGGTQGATPSLTLLDMGPGVETRLKSNAPEVTVTRSTVGGAQGAVVTIQPGKEAFPGVSIKPPLNTWNLMLFGHVEAKVVNTGAKPLMVALRVDNAGDWKDNPWNTESATIDPGASETISTIFGYSYGHKRGFPLKASAVVNVMLFTVKSDLAQSFRIESVVATGPSGEKPPVAPEDIRVDPPHGYILGAGVSLDVSSQVQAKGVQSLIVGTDQEPSLRLQFPVSKDDAVALIRPVNGRWDLHKYLEVQVSFRNMGRTPFTPKVRIQSNGGASDWVSTPVPLAPGSKALVTIPFGGSSPAVVGKAGTGGLIASTVVSAIAFSADSPDLERLLYVDSIQAVIPPAPELPDWLGTRPPVAGNWLKTLDDEFDGTTIDASIWDVKGENYYDKATHWSKEDVIVGGGLLKLRYEKKSGFHNDDPKRPRSDYAAGYLNTYDKWAQRYGYFEARMKLPTAPGVWPAFWMMPDRGNRSTDQGARQDTAKGGMEFDIMENLSGWGQNRYNIAMHYDGYAAAHKSVGSDKIYVQPDKDGFITCGLLWTPGSAIYYCNGKEVLRWEDPRISNVPSAMMFTLPSGGWDNVPLEDGLLPADFVIDYVRVWQRRDLAEPGDGRKPPAAGH